jgi:hypothetical protein
MFFLFFLFFSIFLFNDIRTRSMRMLTLYYAFNIASIIIFVANTAFLGESLRAMYEDSHITEATRDTAAQYVAYIVSFGSAISVSQLYGFFYSRELVNHHLLFEFSREGRDSFRTLFVDSEALAHRGRRHDPRVIGLPEEYINALPTITLAPDWSDPEGPSMCVICQDDLQPGDVVKSLPCKHQFHSKCIDEWLHRSGTCPMCNQGVVEGANQGSPSIFPSTPIAAAAAAQAISINTETDGVPMYHSNDESDVRVQMSPSVTETTTTSTIVTDDEKHTMLEP